ncbi:helix-turn-helix domain-containing protein [Kitasatospora sp. NPDC088134]|uniref:helix-turn-helix domain-containing protein n=1 Tax=Kitasatospora sp. NPDC088134 TaxID=3364071 RepID=UPI003819D8E6
MTSPAPDHARVIPLRPPGAPHRAPTAVPAGPAAPAPREPLWRDLVGGVLRRERLAQERTLKDVAEQARISVPYLSELERGRKEASSEVIAAAARALGLGLGDVLRLVQDDLERPVLRARPLRTTSGAAPAAAPRTLAPRAAAPYDGLCLAA